jgi:hypothetical protein
VDLAVDAGRGTGTQRITEPREPTVEIVDDLTDRGPVSLDDRFTTRKRAVLGH